MSARDQAKREERRARRHFEDDLFALRTRRYLKGRTPAGSVSRILSVLHSGFRPIYEQTYQQRSTMTELQTHFLRRYNIFGREPPDREAIAVRAGYASKQTLEQAYNKTAPWFWMFGGAR